MKKSALFWVLLVLFSSEFANAEGVILGGWFQANTTNNPYVYYDGERTTVDVNRTVGGGAEIGYRWTKWELGLMYEGHQLNSPEDSANGYQVSNVGPYLRRVFPINKRWNFYINGAGGYSWADFKNSVNDNANFYGWFGLGGLGIEWKMFNNLMLMTEGRYTGSVTYSNQDVNAELYDQYGSWLIGLRFHFGARK